MPRDGYLLASIDPQFNAGCLVTDAGTHERETPVTPVAMTANVTRGHLAFGCALNSILLGLSPTSELNFSNCLRGVLVKTFTVN